MDGLEYLYEWTVLRAWVKQWLAYVRWYWLTAWSPDVTIQDFFEAPVVNRSWKVKKTDRFDLVFYGRSMTGLLRKVFSTRYQSLIQVPDFRYGPVLAGWNLWKILFGIICWA
ncbi:hypothetical protein L6164_037866 [Bauhinia variegata]|uniref:Uncharacterized protein n=1 Tax=Bauhinia variegata TaxID=167791 RepID=A0ACB9KLD3_BAUVA|nr:hypothetical protein L6164_037866 [Bauhinia variegata]